MRIERVTQVDAFEAELADLELRPKVYDLADVAMSGVFIGVGNAGNSASNAAMSATKMNPSLWKTRSLWKARRLWKIRAADQLVSPQSSSIQAKARSPKCQAIRL